MMEGYNVVLGYAEVLWLHFHVAGRTKGFSCCTRERLPVHKLKIDVVTRWGSTYDIGLRRSIRIFRSFEAEITFELFE